MSTLDNLGEFLPSLGNREKSFVSLRMPHKVKDRLEILANHYTTTKTELIIALINSAFAEFDSDAEEQKP